MDSTCVEIATKLQDDVLRLQYVKQELQDAGVFKFSGCVNRKVGPPVTLPLEEKEKWDDEIKKSLRNCMEKFLIPAIEAKIDKNKKVFTTLIRERLETQTEATVRNNVLKGFGRSQNKWSKREVRNGLGLPPSLEAFGDLNAGEIGTLRRGEHNYRERNSLVRYDRISSNTDLFKIVAHSIYGSARYSKFIHRSICKYMYAYKDVEEAGFQPHVGLMSNGNNKWISSWRSFYTLIVNGKLCHSAYELDLISKLYDINVEVFINGKEDYFVCIWKTERRCTRIINLLLSPKNEWSLLQSPKTRYSKDNTIIEVSNNTDSQKSRNLDISSNFDQQGSCNNISDKASNTIVVDKDKYKTETQFSVTDSLDSLEGIDSKDELGWSLITSDSESKEELLEIERRVSLLDREDKNYLEWSLITTDSESREELVEIECKVNKHLSIDSLGQNNSAYTHDIREDKVEFDASPSSIEVVRSGEGEYIEKNVNLYNCIDKKEANLNILTADSNNIHIVDNLENHEKVESVERINKSGRVVKPFEIDKDRDKEKDSKEESDAARNDTHKIDSHRNTREDVEWIMVEDVKKGIDKCNKDKIDSSNSEDVLEVREDSNFLGWSLITTDSESKEELLDIERRVCNQFNTDSLGSMNRMHTQDNKVEKAESSVSLCNIESDSSWEMESSNTDKVNMNVGVYSQESNLDSLVELDRESDKDKYSKETKVIESDIIRMSSHNSIEEDFRWLFGEDISNEDRDTCSSDGIDSKDKTVCLTNKIRRRKFWMLWKNKIRNVERNKSRRQDKQLLKEGIQQRSLEAVFDYYSKGLDSTEIEFLSKGSTFCVATSKIEEDRFKADVYAYSRRLRLHEEFREQGWSQLFSQIIREQRDSQESNTSISQNTHTQDSINQSKKKGRKLPSTYDPDSQNRNLARYCSCIQEESLLAVKTKTKFRDNITVEHRKALNSLKKKVEDKEIIITLADKGSGIVVVDYNTYISKGTNYIEVEAKAYSETVKTHKQIVTDIVSQRNKIVKKLREHKVIEIETATYCMKQLEEKVTGMKFYYKIHKDTNINTMPLRPLQSCIGSPTHHLSQVLTDLLQPFLSTEFIPTFIQDSNQLLFRLSKVDSLVEDSTLISSDVAALYPSIPHKEGLKAVSDFLVEWSDYNSTQIKYIMLALELVITQNYVMWNGKIYSQDSGVAMGTPVAVAYANIFMDYIDTQLRQRASFIIEHIRYIDDNLFIIPEDRIEELMAIANSLLSPHIKFTYEKLDKYSSLGLPFLDTQLFISSERKIESRLYTKKTDRHTYLLPTSFHPSHITRNIPLAVFNRIRRICSKKEWFQVDAMLAMQWLEDRGYKYLDIKRAVEKSSNRDRWEMIEKIEQNRVSRKVTVDSKAESTYEIPVIITYCQNAKYVKEVFKKRQDLLDVSFNQTRVRPRLAFRRQRNINDTLIQKGLRKPIIGNLAEESILEACGIKHRYRTQCPCKGNHDQLMCRCCAHLKLKLEKVEVKLSKKVNCESKNVIYVLGCKICHKLYVGETQQQLKDRFLQHLNNISKLSQPLYIHFRQVHKADNIFISVLEAVRCSDHMFRKIREAWWINKLQTLEPRGFNVKLECSQIYQASNTTINIEREKSTRRI